MAIGRQQAGFGDDAVLMGLMGEGPGANALFNDPPGMEGALADADEMFQPMPAGRAGKGKKRKGALARPGDGIKPSTVLNQIGWVLWSFSWLSTTNALRYVVFAVLSFAVALVGIELPALVLHLLALAAGGGAAWVVQLRLTAIERPLLTGYVSVVGGAALVIDLALNYGGVRFAAPYLATVFNVSINTLWMVVGAIGLTVLAEVFLTVALVERRKGY